MIRPPAYIDKNKGCKEFVNLVTKTEIFLYERVNMDDVYQLIKDIEKCPSLYLGKPSLERLFAFLNGYKHHKSSELNQPDCLTGFQDFVENYYNINTDHNWASLIQFFCNSEEEAFKEFYRLFDKFSKDRFG